MVDKTVYPGLVTVINGFVASLSLIFVAMGELQTGIRLIFLCMALDVLDGLIARLLEATSEKGEFLDRLYDRVYQIIVPALLYTRYMGWSWSSIAYSSLIVTVALWRLSRRVPGREYFAGLPLFIHTMVILSSFLSGISVRPEIMLILAVLSLLPLKYYRRSLKYSSSENRGTYWSLRLAVPLILAFVPYKPLKPLFVLLLYSSLFYTFVGWLPFVRGKGSLSQRLLHLSRVPVYR